MRRTLKSVADVERCARHLKPLNVPGEDGIEDPPEWVLAQDLQGIEESCAALVDELIPQLLETESDLSATHDALGAIRDEVRHLVYHLQTPVWRGQLMEQERTKP